MNLKILNLIHLTIFAIIMPPTICNIVTKFDDDSHSKVYFVDKIPASKNTYFAISNEQDIDRTENEKDLLNMIFLNNFNNKRSSQLIDYRRSCIRRGGACDHRPNDCCYNSSCRCNLWGSNCRCQRMGLFQKWG